MKKSDVKVKGLVTVKERVEGYYSNYGGNPAIWLEPDMVGTVGAIDVPSICREGVSFVCVDFFCPATGRTERAAVHYSNLCKCPLPPTEGEELFKGELQKLDQSELGQRFLNCNIG